MEGRRREIFIFGCSVRDVFLSEEEDSIASSMRLLAFARDLLADFVEAAAEEALFGARAFFALAVVRVFEAAAFFPLKTLALVFVVPKALGTDFAPEVDFLAAFAAVGLRALFVAMTVVSFVNPLVRLQYGALFVFFLIALMSSVAWQKTVLS